MGNHEMTMRFRLLGLVPLAVFILHFLYHNSIGAPGLSMWMCHASNVVLALGLFLGKPSFIRVAVMWIAVGIPPWIYEMALTSDWPPTSFLSHTGGISVGLIALWRVRAGRFTWIHAFAFGLVIQELSRLFTPPALNVNLAHHARDGAEKVLTAYWQYWLITTVLVAVGLWIIGRVFMKVFPNKLEKKNVVAQTA